MRKYCEENWVLVYRNEKIAIFENPNKIEIKGYKKNNIYSFLHETFWNNSIKDDFIKKEIKKY